MEIEGTKPDQYDKKQIFEWKGRLRGKREFVPRSHIFWILYLKVNLFGQYKETPIQEQLQLFF